jgi:DNA-binding phage protein
MSDKIRIADLPEFDVTEYLDDDQAIAGYLTVVLEEDDPPPWRRRSVPSPVLAA